MSLRATLVRCMEALEADMLPEERIKVLRVLASTANKMAENIEIDEQLKEIDNAQLV